MVSSIKKGLLGASVILASTLTTTTATANAASDATAEKGTMGYGYQKYMQKHPEKKQAQNNKSNGTTAFRSATQESGVAQGGNRVLDISEWQGKLNDAQVQQLKQNYDFIIIRAQYGSERVDATVAHNSALLDKYGLDFGVYSYSMYENPQDARYEARTLFNRAPKAKFYVNDFEQNTVTSGTTDEATSAWYDEMKSLAGNRKVLFYSYENFMLQNAANSVGDYDGYWLASYTDQTPTRENVLWQYTDSYYSPELQQKVDANYINPTISPQWFTS